MNSYKKVIKKTEKLTKWVMHSDDPEALKIKKKVEKVIKNWRKKFGT